MYTSKLSKVAVLRSVERAEHTQEHSGFCTACGHEQEHCSPDAQQWQCESCGQHAVYGNELVLDALM